jgi:hypothetical protein
LVRVYSRNIFGSRADDENMVGRLGLVGNFLDQRLYDFGATARRYNNGRALLDWLSAGACVPHLAFPTHCVTADGRGVAPAVQDHVGLKHCDVAC